jgi:predicted nucleic acid-binding protein
MKKNIVITECFLDTTILISAITGRNLKCVEILENRKFVLYANEYAIKEVRRILKDVFKLTSEDINESMDHIRSRCNVLPQPSTNEIINIRITDKSDKPMVATAKKLKIPLIIDDHTTYVDAKKYIQTYKSYEIQI